LEEPEADRSRTGSARSTRTIACGAAPAGAEASTDRNSSTRTGPNGGRQEHRSPRAGALVVWRNSCSGGTGPTRRPTGPPRSPVLPPTRSSFVVQLRPGPAAAPNFVDDPSARRRNVPVCTISPVQHRPCARLMVIRQPRGFLPTPGNASRQPAPFRAGGHCQPQSPPPPPPRLPPSSFSSRQFSDRGPSHEFLARRGSRAGLLSVVRPALGNAPRRSSPRSRPSETIAAHLRARGKASMSWRTLRVPCLACLFESSHGVFEVGASRRSSAARCRHRRSLPELAAHLVTLAFHACRIVSELHACSNANPAARRCLP